MTPFLAALLQHLTPRLTPAHIATLADDEYDAPSRILRLTSSELQQKLGIKGGLAADILDFADAAKGTDFGKSQAAQAIVIQTTLENLVGADTIRTAAVESLRSHRILLVVVGEDQELLTAETMIFLASPDRQTAERQGYWKDYGLVSIDTFLPDTSPLRSPYNPAPLVEGTDAAGLIWGSLPRERLGLAVWAVENGLDAGRPHADILADFLVDSELYNKARKRAKAKGLKMEDLRELAKAPVRSRTAPTPSGGKSFSAQPHTAFYELLLDLFGDKGPLSRFLSRGNHANPSELPNGGSFAEFAHQAVNTMGRRGDITQELFDDLAREFPRRRADIATVAAKFSITLA